MAFQPLWSQISDSPDVLGRYSTRYAAGLLLYFVLAVGWIILFVCRKYVMAWLEKITARTRYTLLAVVSVMMIGVLGASSLIRLDGTLTDYFVLNGFLAIVGLMYDQDDSRLRWLGWFAALLLTLMLSVLILHALTSRPFNPDEAMWADFATGIFNNSPGIYSDMWLQEPILIKPGIGWSVAGYGWLLHNVHFDILVGRVWNVVAYVLTFVGIGLVTRELYGSGAAVVSVALAVLTRLYLPILDFRPDHQLAFAALFCTFAAVRARRGGHPLWHTLCGLLAVLSMELHAAGIVFAFGFSLFYALETASSYYQTRQRTIVLPLSYFVIGAATGTAIYYMFNIYPVGGLQPYLDYLISERGARMNWFPFLAWPGILERFIVWGSLAYILWRRNEADRLLLGIVACVLVSITLLDTQGYRTTYSGFYLVAVGALITGTLKSRYVVPSLLIILLIGLISIQVINWQTISGVLRGEPNPVHRNVRLGAALRPYTTVDDVIVSTHELLWEYHEPDDTLFSVSAEPGAMLRWQLTDPADVWRRVQPTVIIEVADRMVLSDGLLSYMDEEGFQVCETLDLSDGHVTVYRPDCEIILA